MATQRGGSTDPSHARALLDRLERVTERGGGHYMAQCPAHDDSNPSLSVREVDDRVLVHCFAGCSAGAIVAAAGLSLADLYVASPTRNLSPLPRARRYDAHALLRLLAHEALVVAIAADDVANGKPLSETDREHLTAAALRIRHSIEALT